MNQSTTMTGGQDASTDAAAYATQPVNPDEFGQPDEDPLAWDAEGWVVQDFA